MEPLKRSKNHNLNNETTSEQSVADKTETLYQNALDLMSKNRYSDYEFAALIFETIRGYKDSDELFTQCKETIKTIKYNQARELMNDNTMTSLEKALDLLKDCDQEDVLVKECKTALVSLTYQEAQDLFSNEQYEEALEQFKKIVNYEDSNELIEQCETILKEREEKEQKGGFSFLKFFLVIILLALIGVGGWFGFKYFTTTSLITNVVTIELGEETKLDPALFLSADSKNIKASDLTIASSLMTDTDNYTYDESTKVVVSKDKEYLEVGEYEVTISTKDGSTAAVTYLVVKDTTSPSIICQQSEFQYTIWQEHIDFRSNFTVEDKSEVTLDIDESGINWDVAGTYQVKAIATDAYGNKTEMSANVVVNEPEYEEQAQTYYDTNYYYYYTQPVEETPAENGEQAPQESEGNPSDSGSEGSGEGEGSGGSGESQDSTLPE